MVLQTIPRGITSIFLHEIEIVMFLPPHPFGQSNPSNSVTYLEQPELMMLLRIRGMAKIPGSHTVWDTRYIK
jgi:hypothetical protein